MRHLPYNKNLKAFSRHLRLNSTLGEVLLWKYLRAGGMNYQFNRQKPLNNYIVDFYCKPLNVIIEIDGKYHGDEEQIVKDVERQKFLEQMKLSVLRFTELEVRNNMQNVLRSIENYILDYEEKYPDVKSKSIIAHRSN
jgi:very-short-patch-repair endonuclease